jgi:sporulation integral membrane protein YtvI
VPESVRKPLTDSIRELFSGGSALLDRVTEVALSLAGGVLRSVPDSALGLGTAVISAYMISARLPKIRAGFKGLLGERLQPLLESLRRIKTAVLGWLQAQVKLMTVTWAVMSVGFLILRIPYGLLWAAAVALVDAFPVLGTGTVLVPWSLICFLQGDSARGIGLLGIYGAAALIRSALEPKLVGKHLGLDPLVTLFALYAGYKLWGLMGMLLAPLLAVAATQVIAPKPQDSL